MVFTYNYTVNRTIADGSASGVVDVRNVATGLSGVSITDVNVSLDISGPTARNGDFFASLQHDVGYSVLLNRAGRRAGSNLGYGDAGLNVILDDHAANGDIHNYRQALFGTHNQSIGGALTESLSDRGAAWQPDARNVDPFAVTDASPRTAGLGSFNGLSVDGNWRLFVADLAAGGRSTLVGWGLEIRGTTDSANQLTFDGATIRAEGAPRTLANPIEIANNAVFSGSEQITVNGPITGSGTLEKSGSGILVLGGANTGFAGGFHMQSGTVVLGHNDSFGSGEVRLAGGVIQADGGARTINNTVRLEGNATFSGPNPITFNNSTVVQGLQQLSVENRTEFAAPVTEGTVGSGLIKSGSGTLVLGGASTYTGGTVINAGRLIVSNTHGSGTGSGAVDVRTGGILAGSGTIGGTVTISNGGIIAPGNSPGTQTTGSQTWGANGTYEWEINSASTTLGTGKGTDPGYDWLDISSGESATLTITATAGQPYTIKVIGLSDSSNQGVVSGFSNAQNYTWILATATGGVSDFDPSKLRVDSTDFANNNSLGGGTFSLGVSGNDIRLQFTAVPEPREYVLACGIFLLVFVLVRKPRCGSSDERLKRAS